MSASDHRLGQASTAPGAAVAPALNGEALIPLVEEQAHVSKRQVETGHVRVKTVVEAREALIAQTLAHQALSVERRVVEQQVEVAPPVRQEGDTTIISIVEERAVVSKVLFVVEELVIPSSARLLFKQRFKEEPCLTDWRTR